MEPTGGRGLLSDLAFRIARRAARPETRPRPGLGTRGSGPPDAASSLGGNAVSVLLPVEGAQHEVAELVELLLQLAVVVDGASAEVGDLVSHHRAVQAAAAVQLEGRVGGVDQRSRLRA